MSTVSSPSDAPYTAEARPAGPPPMTARSYIGSDGSVDSPEHLGELTVAGSTSGLALLGDHDRQLQAVEPGGLEKLRCPWARRP